MIFQAEQTSRDPISIVANTLQIRDVTDDKHSLQVAFTMVAENYALLSTRDLTIEETYQELCTDLFYRKGISRTILATGYHPIRKEISDLATARVIVNFRSNNDTPALEAMHLVHPPNGWENFDFMGFNPASSAEIGRFVVIPDCRQSKIGATSLVTFLLEQIFWQCVDIAHKHNKDQIWAIMPKYTVRIVESFGVKCIPIPAMQLNYREHHNLFNKYNRYWLHGNPWFYRFDI
ncbi:MAG: hypothetical protein R3C14_23030 [Caldilineaceae bacterium]